MFCLVSSVISIEFLLHLIYSFDFCCCTVFGSGWFEILMMLFKRGVTCFCVGFCCLKYLGIFVFVDFFWSSNVNDMCYVCVCSQWVLAQMTSPHLVRATWRGLGFNTHCLCVCLCVVLRSIWGIQSLTFSWSEWLNLSLVDTCPLCMMNLKLFYAFVI